MLFLYLTHFPHATVSPRPENTHGLLLFSCLNPHTATMFRNTWPYWYGPGGTVSEGDGKRAAYDKLEVHTLTFVVVRARDARYSPPRRPTRLVFLVKAVK